jgi:hypothetical protein
MANKVLLKKSSVSDRVPTTSDLDYGELAINYADGKLYFKDSSNNIDYFTSASTAATTDSFKTISVNGQDSVVADSSVDTLTLVAGTGIEITTDATNDSITFSSTSGSSAEPEFNVVGRSAEITTKLTGLMQNYLDFDATTFRNNVATIITRSATVTVTG